MAGGLGIIIVDEQEHAIVYKKKCEKCGHVEPGTTRCNKPNRGATLSGGFVCSKCRQHQDIKIYG